MIVGAARDMIRLIIIIMKKNNKEEKTIPGQSEALDVAHILKTIWNIWVFIKIKMFEVLFWF